MAFKRQMLTPRVIQDLKKRSTIGILFYFVAIGVVLSTDGYYFRHLSFSRQFVVLIAGICIFRGLHLLAAPWIPAKLDRVNQFVFIGSIALTGLIWGVGFAIFLLQEGEPQIQMLMVVCTLGLCSGGVVAYTPFLWLSLLFNLLILGPGIVCMMGSDVYLSMGALFILFCVYMIFMAFRANNEYWDALENEFLLKEKTKSLEKISQRDGLTGLYNRRYFDMAFELEWRRGIRKKTPIVMMLCDIDGFKPVNDTFGHLAGDEYIKLVARVLGQVFQRESDIVARYGGDEFVALMPEESLENAAALAERVRKKIADAILEFEAHSIRTTLSLGVAGITPQSSGQKDLLIARADTAMYAAKKNGRNQVHVYDI